MPAIKTFLWAKFIITTPSELVPSISGKHSKEATFNIFHISLLLELKELGLINIL